MWGFPGRQTGAPKVCCAAQVAWRLSAGPDGGAGRGWAGTHRAAGEAQRMVEPGPTPCSFHLSSRRKRDLVGSREINRETCGPGMKTPGCPRGCRPCLPDSFLKSLAHATYQPDPSSHQCLVAQLRVTGKGCVAWRWLGCRHPTLTPCARLAELWSPCGAWQTPRPTARPTQGALGPVLLARPPAHPAPPNTGELPWGTP